MREVIAVTWNFYDSKTFFCTLIDSKIIEILWEFFQVPQQKFVGIFSFILLLALMFLSNVIKSIFFKTQTYEYKIYLS